MELPTDELTLHYEDDGDPEAPPILVLHGITQSVATWGWLVPHLADAHRVVRLDFRVHGRSGRTPGAYVSRGYVADATAICEQVLGRPAVVIGHSLGGDLARLASHSPQIERRVVAGAGHLMHDSKQQRHAVLDAVLDLLARVAGPGQPS